MSWEEHGVNVYGLDDFPAEYVRFLDGELNMEKWRAGTGVYVTPLRMMSDGSLCLYQPGDKICVQQLDGTNKIYDVLAVVDIPKALETPLQVDMGLDYIFPTNELLGNMVSAHLYRGESDSGSNDGGRIKLFYMAFYPASCVPLCNTVSSHYRLCTFGLL